MTPDFPNSTPADDLEGAPTVSAREHDREPLDSLDPRPVMTTQEATFHTAVAGSTAAKEATSRGCDPEQAKALGEVAVGGRKFGGVVFQRPSAYSAFAVSASHRLFEGWGRPLSPMESRAVFLYCFASPRDAYLLSEVEADAETLLAEARKLAVEIDDPDSLDLAEAWCMECFLRLNGAKKQPGAVATADSDAPEIAPKQSLNSISPVTAPGAVPVG